MPTFGAATVENQTYTQNTAIATLNAAGKRATATAR